MAAINDIYYLVEQLYAQVARPGEMIQRIGENRFYLILFMNFCLYQSGVFGKRAQQYVHGLVQVANGSRYAPNFQAGIEGPQPAQGQLYLYTPLAA